MVSKKLIAFAAVAIVIFAAVLIAQQFAISRENKKHQSRTLEAAEDATYNSQVIFCVIPARNVRKTAEAVCSSIRLAKLPSRLWFVIAQTVDQKSATDAIDRLLKTDARSRIAQNVARENVRLCWMNNSKSTTWLQEALAHHYRNEQYILTFEEDWEFKENWDENLINELHSSTAVIRAQTPTAQVPIITLNAANKGRPAFHVARPTKQGVIVSDQPRRKRETAFLETSIADAGDMFSKAESILRALSVCDTGTRCMTLEVSAGADSQGIRILANRSPVALVHKRNRRLPVALADRNGAVKKWSTRWGLQLGNTKVSQIGGMGLCDDAREDEILARVGSIARYREM